MALPHRGAAYHVAYWILRDRSDAEDAVQDAYLRAFRAFDGFEGDAIRPWLFTIVRNAAYRIIEKRNRAANIIRLEQAFRGRDPDDDLDFPSEAPTPEDIIIAESVQNDLRAALAELPLAYREMLVLRELEGLSYIEIAEMTGLVMGTVMSRLARGRDMLRKAVQRRAAKDKADAV